MNQFGNVRESFVLKLLKDGEIYVFQVFFLLKGHSKEAFEIELN